MKTKNKSKPHMFKWFHFYKIIVKLNLKFVNLDSIVNGYLAICQNKNFLEIYIKMKGFKLLMSNGFPNLRAIYNFIIIFSNIKFT